MNKQASKIKNNNVRHVLFRKAHLS